jgi:hypothetical protein
MRRTNITDHAGVLMGSTGPKSGGYSGSQPRGSRGLILRNIKEGAARFGGKGPQPSKSREFFQEEFHAPRHEEVPVAQLDLGPRPVIFEKPREKNYRHLKALYLKGYINGQPVSRMLVDTGAAVNIMRIQCYASWGILLGT